MNKIIRFAVIFVFQFLSFNDAALADTKQQNLSKQEVNDILKIAGLSVDEISSYTVYISEGLVKVEYYSKLLQSSENICRRLRHEIAIEQSEMIILGEVVHFSFEGYEFAFGRCQPTMKWILQGDDYYLNDRFVVHIVEKAEEWFLTAEKDADFKKQHVKDPMPNIDKLYFLSRVECSEPGVFVVTLSFDGYSDNSKYSNFRQSIEFIFEGDGALTPIKYETSRRGSHSRH